MESIVRIHSVISGFAMICGIFLYHSRLEGRWQAEGIIPMNKGEEMMSNRVSMVFYYSRYLDVV